MCSPKSPLNNIRINYDALGSVQVVLANMDSIIEHTTSNSNIIDEEYKDGLVKAPRKVAFGGVTVHVHNLTLGDNPGGATPGPPLTLEWERDFNQHYKNVEEYAKSINSMNHGRQRKRKKTVLRDGEYHRAKIIDTKKRSRIVAVDHSAKEIKKVLLEIYLIRQHREESKNEDIDKAEKKEEKKRKAKEKILTLTNNKAASDKKMLRKMNCIVSHLLTRLSSVSKKVLVMHKSSPTYPSYCNQQSS